MGHTGCVDAVLVAEVVGEKPWIRLASHVGHVVSDGSFAADHQSFRRDDRRMCQRRSQETNLLGHVVLLHFLWVMIELDDMVSFAVDRSFATFSDIVSCPQGEVTMTFKRYFRRSFDRWHDLPPHCLGE